MDKDLESSENEHKLNNKEAMSELYKAEKDIALKIPLKTYTSPSDDLHGVRVAMNIVFASGTFFTGVGLLFGLNSFMFTWGVIGLIGGSIGSVIAGANFYAKSPSAKKKKYYDWILSRKQRLHMLENRKNYNNYIERKLIHKMYIEHKRQELQRSGVFDVVNSENNSGNWFILDSSGTVQSVSVENMENQQSTNEFETKKVEDMMQEILESRNQSSLGQEK